ncbi:integration host factor, actinobacterial type [Rhodococcus oxybenzonivorans]|uniref:integration host factor, actinobacterial type n=1 Tax=Rhodococcus oxybenzonivorans TaxID=1990687 RepID=UPI0019500299|nr:integration host factor, actinobacterial type [Rhodococcus oxybenzonivorans]
MRVLAVPDLSAEQRADARRVALEARTVRARALTEISAGRWTVPRLLAAAQAERALARTKVEAVLRALPGVGPVGSRVLLARAGIAENRRVGALTERQRRSLTEITEYPIRWRSDRIG